MNNERILKLALDAGLLNYVDNETPRHYFVHGHADLEEVEKFAELIVRECAEFANEHNFGVEGFTLGIGKAIEQHFGVEE